MKKTSKMLKRDGPFIIWGSVKIFLFGKNLAHLRKSGLGLNQVFEEETRPHPGRREREVTHGIHGCVMVPGSSGHYSLHYMRLPSGIPTDLDKPDRIQT